MPLLKICGVADEDNAVEISKYCDYIGIIVDPSLSSPRLVDPERARRIVHRCSYRKIVAIVSDKKGIDLAASIGVKIVQLHCPYSEDKVEYAVSRGLKVAPVLISDTHEVSRAQVETFLESVVKYREHIEYVLLDAAKSLQPTETGLKLSLSSYRIFIGLCREYGLKAAVAGGVNLQNVDLLLELNPDVIDVSSSVEVRPGVKDLNLVTQLARKIKGINYGTY